MSEEQQDSATYALLAGQRQWQDQHMQRFLQNAINDPEFDRSDEKAVLMYWAGYLCSFVGAMSASVGFPATKAMLDQVKNETLGNAKGMIYPDS